MKREDKLIKNTAILTVGTAFSSVFSFFLVPIFSKWLTLSEYGTYDVYLTYVTLLIPIFTLACGEATFRFLLDCKSDKERRQVLSSTWFIALCGSFVGVLLIIIFNTIWGIEALIPFILLFISLMLYNQGNFIARGFRKLYVYTISNIIYLIVMAVFVTVFVKYKNWGLNGILLGNAIGHFSGFFYMFFSCKLWKYVSFKKPTWVEFKKIINYSAPLMPNSISWWIVNVSDRGIINTLLGSSFNGIYAISYKLPSLCSTLFGVFHMSWLESSVDALEDDDRVIYTNNVFNQIVPFAFCVAACVLSVNRFFYRWIWDSKYADGIVYVWILLAGMCFSFFSQFLGGILIAEKRTKANGLTTILAAIVNILVHISLIRYIGLYAAAISTFCSYFCLFIVRIILLKQNFDFNLNAKAYIAIFLFIFVALVQFHKNLWVGYATVLVACIVSVIINRELLSLITKKFFTKRKDSLFDE